VREAEAADVLAGAVDVLKALASAVRLATVVVLSEGPHCVHELQTSLEASGRPVSQPRLSQHLKVLRDAGLVTTTRRGTEITYRLVDPHVGRIVSDAIGCSLGEAIMPSDLDRADRAARATVGPR
jgi:DNA-binding transcriptional ArsR family regulator